MALSVLQQASELINKSRAILCVVPVHPSLDALAGLAALGTILQKEGVIVDLLAPGYEKPLPSVITTQNPFQTTLGAVQSLHVCIPVNQTPLAELSYTVTDGQLDISLVPKRGSWQKSDVIIEPGADRYDLVIALGFLDRASLIEAFPAQSAFFQRVPSLSITSQGAAEAWATVSLHETNTSSLCEQVYHLAQDRRYLLNETLATTLLTGVIAATNRFSHPHVNEQTLRIATKLVEKGARRQDIMHELWRTTSISTLQLWGRALSRLERLPNHPLIWTHLTDADLLDFHTKTLDLEGLVHQLLGQIPEARLVLIIQQQGDELRCVLFARDTLSAIALARIFAGTGTPEQAEWSIPHKQDPLGTRTQLLATLAAHLDRLNKS